MKNEKFHERFPTGPRIIMVALWNRAEWQTIIFSSCHLFFFFLSFFRSFFFFSSPNLSRRRVDVCHGPSANLRCRSETCCTRLTEKTGCKKVAKNHHLGTIAQLCRAIPSQLRHVSAIGKKLVKQQCVLHMSS